MVILAIWVLIVLPLTLVGAIIGRNVSGTPDHPCRITPIPRPIPEKKWCVAIVCLAQLAATLTLVGRRFMEPLVIIMAGGVLPFGSIFIEMYFIFTSFWAYKVYYVYGFMLLVFVILTVVTTCVTIVCTYFLLNAEVRAKPFQLPHAASNLTSCRLDRIIDGSGRVSSLVQVPPSTCTCTRHTTSSSRRKCLESFRRHSTLVTAPSWPWRSVRCVGHLAMPGQASSCTEFIGTSK